MYRYYMKIYTYVRPYIFENMCMRWPRTASCLAVGSCSQELLASRRGRHAFVDMYTIRVYII